MFATDNEEKTPFDCACRGNQAAVINFFLERYATAVFERERDLSFHSILRGATYSHVVVRPLGQRRLQVKLPLGKLTTDHMRTLFQLFDSHLILSADGTGALPLHTACRFRAPVEIVTILVEQDGLALRFPDSAGARPLHIACRFNARDDDVIRFLVEQAPRTLRTRDHEKSLPVHAACQGGASARSISRLVEHEQGGDWMVSVRNKSGDLPLHCLLCGSNPTVEAVEYLLGKSPETVSATNVTGVLPLWLACGASAPEGVVYILLRKHPDVLKDSMAVVAESEGPGA